MRLAGRRRHFHNVGSNIMPQHFMSATRMVQNRHSQEQSAERTAGHRRSRVLKELPDDIWMCGDILQDGRLLKCLHLVDHAASNNTCVSLPPALVVEL